MKQLILIFDLYVFILKMSSSNIRYGPGVTQEIGMDFDNMKAKHLGVYTDKNLIDLPAMKVVLDSLHKSNINYKVFDNVRVEPTDQRYVIIKCKL